jgi:hypothetical protein
MSDVSPTAVAGFVCGGGDGEVEPIPLPLLRIIMISRKLM